MRGSLQPQRSNPLSKVNTRPSMSSLGNGAAPAKRTVVMQQMHRYTGLKQQGIGERFGGLDGRLVSRDCRAIREKIETEPRFESGFRNSRS